MIGGLRIGMPVLAEHNDLREDVSLCASLGLDFIELNANLPRCMPERLRTADVSAMTVAAGIGLTYHAAEDCDPFHFNPLVAAAWRETLRRYISIALDLKVPVITMHYPDGVYFTLPESRHYLYEQESALHTGALDTWQQLFEEESGGQILCCIENTDGFHLFQRDGIDRLLACPAFGLTWDVGHDYSAGGADRPFLMERANRIRHMHLHDAGPGGNHLALGDGVLDAGSMLAFAREHGCRVVLEIKTADALSRSVSWIRAWAERDGNTGLC